MAVYTHVSAEALGTFLARYDVGELVSAKGIAEGVENSNYLVDTTTGRFILTLYEKRVDSADLPFFFAMLDHLAERDNPVPPAIKDRNGNVIQTLEGKSACLIKFLPGISLSHPNAAQAIAAGAALGGMHAALKDFPLARPNSMGAESWRPLFERCGRSLDEITPGFHDSMGFALDAVLKGWDASRFEQSTIHADLFPDNVLMRGNDVSGLIDFYFACTDIRVYDLAIMHSAWAFDAQGRNYDAAVGDGLIAGYERHFPLSDVERAEFTRLASGACIRFTLSRAWDWLNTPADALVTRKDPLAYWRRLTHYAPEFTNR